MDDVKTTTQAAQATASFGFRDVPAAEKATLVRGVFDRVAAKYDVMNDAMSLGLHRAWKDALVTALAPRAGEELLDLAGGTGDVAFRIRARAPQSQVMVVDINAAMLGEGRARAYDRNTYAGLHFACGDAQSLPLATNTVDGCTMAFGIRNVTNIPQALRDIHRVLTPGGRFCCLEFSPAINPAFKPIYDAFSFHLIPPMGKILAGDDTPYRYLVESIRRFPPPEKFAQMIREAGFSAVTHRSMAGGVVALHQGWKF